MKPISLTEQMPRLYAENATKESLTGLLAYSDAAHERLGRDYWHSLVVRMSVASDAASLSEWKFEMLASQALRTLATEEAQEARVLVLATDSATPLPDCVKTWFESGHIADSAHRQTGWLIVLLSEISGYSGRYWPELEYITDIATLSSRELVIYAVPSSERYNPFHLADIKCVDRNGIFPVREFRELRALTG